MKKSPLIAVVVLDINLDKPLDYSIPEELTSTAQIGMRVEVPVRGRAQKGFILEIKEETQVSSLKPISGLISETPLITNDLFKLAQWASKYYCTPIRSILKLILPSPVRKGMKAKEQLYVMRAKSKEELRVACIEIRSRKPAQAEILEAMLKVKKGIFLSKLILETKSSRSSVEALSKDGYITLQHVKIDRSPLVDEEYFISHPKQLTEEQSKALEKIISSIESNHFEAHLIHGVTGSGKTEVYLQAIDRTLKEGKSVIMLVPEIALTTQTIERFRSRFKEKIAILHYRMSLGERNDEWHRIRIGEAKIVIGARSAVFSPASNLGLIIVDEEHEASYKQTDLQPCYHARDVAVVRAKQSNCPIILGSATPSLDSYYNAKKGKYVLSELHARAGSATSLPTVLVVDMKKEFEKANGFTNFSGPLLDGIKARLEKGEQTILFLNRRGYHTTMVCQSCSVALKCVQCDVTLTFHLGDNCLACHLCGYHLAPPPKECSTCKNGIPLKFKGVGTEQIERALNAIFPTIRTIRVDADTTKHKGSQQKLLRDFGCGKADVLIGTQMIAKGLHFSEVTLVGILNADSGLNIPDFRASEVTFQLITQVIGRSGRGGIKGEAIIQTMLPESNVIQHAANQNYLKFFEEEVAIRELFRYPPFSQMAKLSLCGPLAKSVLEAAERLRKDLLNHLPSTFEFHPVVPCGRSKAKGRHKFQFLIRGPSMVSFYRVIEQLQPAARLPRDIRLLIDVNPSSTFF